MVEDEVEPRIERIPGVSSLLKVGGSEREVKVLIDPQKLIAHGVDLDALSSAIRRGNLNVRGGTVPEPRLAYAQKMLDAPVDNARLGNDIADFFKAERDWQEADA